MEKWYSVREAAEITGLHLATIMFHVRGGTLRAVKNGDRQCSPWRISRQALLEFTTARAAKANQVAQRVLAAD